MPIPKPRSDETKDQFISRCMGSEDLVGEFPEQSQRAAVCNTAWRNSKQMSKTYDLKTEIFATGKWNGLTFNQQDLDTIVAAFESLREVHKVPLKFGHNDEQPMTDGQPALGWVEKIWTEAGKLFAHFTDVPEVVYDAVKSKRYRHVSVELDMGVEHKGNHYPWVLSGVALLGADIPAVNTINDLTTYMGREELSFSKRVAFSAIQGTVTKTKEAVMADEKLEAQVRALQAQVDQLTEQNKVFAREKVELESQVTEFKAKEELNAKKAEKAKFAQARTDLEGRLEELVKADVITPAQREKFMAEFKAEDDAVAKLNFTLDVLEEGKAGKAGFKRGEQAHDDKGGNMDRKDEEGKSVDQIVTARAKKFMRENNVQDFASAKRQVLQLDDDLAAQYRDCNGVKRA